MNDRDAYMALVLKEITAGVMRIEIERGSGIAHSLTAVADFAPEIAACARRIADAVIEERTLMPGGAA